MWLASSTNWGTTLQDWYTRSYQVAFSSASPRLCWFWWPGDSGWVKKRPELPTWRGQSIHVQQIFKLFWCPMSSDVQRHIDGHWLLAEECCGMLRMREDDFSGMKFLRGSDVFGATKFLTHQGARFSLRGINKCCDWKGRWKLGWIHILFAPWQITSESIPEKQQGTPNRRIETVENHFQFDRSSFTSPLVN